MKRNDLQADSYYQYQASQKKKRNDLHLKFIDQIQIFICKNSFKNCEKLSRVVLIYKLCRSTYLGFVGARVMSKNESYTERIGYRMDRIQNGSDTERIVVKLYLYISIFVFRIAIHIRY